MKKTNMAIAALAVVLSSQAFAGATVYGRAHMSADYQDNGTKTLSAISNNSSYLGIEGEDGPVVFKFETSVALDGESTTGNMFASQRDTYVGLRGSYGTLVTGNLSQTYRSIRGDLFEDRLGDMRALNSSSAEMRLVEDRVANSVMYTSPSFGNVTLTGGAALHEKTALTATDRGNAYFAGAEYKGNTFKVSYAVANVEKGGTTSDLTSHRIGGQVDVTPALDLRASVTHHTVGSADTARVYTAGAAYKLSGGYTLKAQHGMSESNDAAGEGAITTAGVDYALGKNTTVYSAYSYLNNGNKGTLAFAGGHGDTIAAPTAGKDVSAFTVGMIHLF
jgi:predicted porin